MGEINKVIYKKDSKGKIRFLHIYSYGGQVIQKSGLVGGQVVTHSSQAKPKNVGRSNETTTVEQARLEAEAKLKAKLDEGYFETVEEAENEEVILPMLAKSFDKEKKKIDWTNAYVQPKLDGMRCLDTPKGKISRKNKSIDTVDHIQIDREISGKTVVDGELYAHGLSFQENMKLIKKKRPGTENVKFHVYDIISELPFHKRLEYLETIVKCSENLELVPTYKVTTMSDVKEYHKAFIAKGYEGTMIRWGNEGYKINGRSSNLLKYKDFIDKTYEVVDIVPSDKNPEQGVIHCKLEDGRTFGCGMKFSHSERETMLIEKEDYIGQIAEIRFFEYSDDGIPRFPICCGFRLDC